MWQTPSITGKSVTDQNPCAQVADHGAAHINARKSGGQNRRVSNFENPFEEEPSVTLDGARKNANLDAVMNAIRACKTPPNAEQQAFLDAFVARLKTERLEEMSGGEKPKDSTPLFDVLHGLPGTGKSRVIAWMRELMEAGLGWTHGIQFVCLAFQNAMAALINGYTIHHWSGIPACTTTEGGSGFGDSRRLSIKCQSMRVIIIDELSMVSAELLGALEYAVNKVIRSKHPIRNAQMGAIGLSEESM